MKILPKLAHTAAIAGDERTKPKPVQNPIKPTQNLLTAADKCKPNSQEQLTAPKTQIKLHLTKVKIQTQVHRITIRLVKRHTPPANGIIVVTQGEHSNSSCRLHHQAAAQPRPTCSDCSKSEQQAPLLEEILTLTSHITHRLLESRVMAT